MKWVFIPVLFIWAVANAQVPGVPGGMMMGARSSGGGGGGTVACDYGPSYTGAVPDGATRAGFTRCAANFDFSQFTNVNQFIDCFGAASPLLYTSDAGSGSLCNSAHFAVVNDGGVQALKTSWAIADGTTIPQLIANTTVGQVFPAYVGLTVPNAMFVELTWRVSSVSQCSVNCLVWGPFVYPHSGVPTAFVENDFDEVSTGPGGTNQAINTNLQDNNGIPTPEFDPLHYHTYGMRTTTDGAGNFATCQYYSHAVVAGLPGSSFNTCGTRGYGTGVATSRKNLIVTWGPNPNDTPHITAGYDMYLARLTLWECPTWQNANEHTNIFAGAQCNGTLLTNSP